MKILATLESSIQKREPELTQRLFGGGRWEFMGHVKRGVDTRTTEQLLENIEYFSKRFPEVVQFKDELKKMNPKHLGLISDICELASHDKLIDIREPVSKGKSLFQILLEKLLKASKENPASIELSQEIINNADSIGAKYALRALSPLLDCKDVARHMEATIPMVSDIAEATLNGGNGGYTMVYSKEMAFAVALRSFIYPKVSLEKLKLLSSINKIADESNAICKLYAFPFLRNNTAMSKLLANLETFKTLDKNMQGKSINLTEFLEKNVNML